MCMLGKFLFIAFFTIWPLWEIGNPMVVMSKVVKKKEWEKERKQEWSTISSDLVKGNY